MTWPEIIWSPGHAGTDFFIKNGPDTCPDHKCTGCVKYDSHISTCFHSSLIHPSFTCSHLSQAPIFSPSLLPCFAPRPSPLSLLLPSSTQPCSPSSLPPLAFHPFFSCHPPTISSLLATLHSLLLRIRESGSCPVLFYFFLFLCLFSLLSLPASH